MYEVLHSLPWKIFQLWIKRFPEKNFSVHLERIQGYANFLSALKCTDVCKLLDCDNRCEDSTEDFVSDNSDEDEKI